jgi:hypothetical protein
VDDYTVPVRYLVFGSSTTEDADKIMGQMQTLPVILLADLQETALFEVQNNEAIFIK